MAIPRKNAICHPEKRNHAYGKCRACYCSDPAQLEKARLKYQRKSPEEKRRVCDLNRNWNLRRKYGITEEDYENMEAQQKGLCKLCGASEVIARKGRPPKLSVDHCHKTGKVRGLLCFKCNTSIALIEARPEILDKIGDYLK